MPTTPKTLRRKVLKIHGRLLKAYGHPRRGKRYGEALSVLMSCILSQHTSDQNSGRAYETLRARFPTWAAVRDAPPHEVIAAIHTAGLANQKGPRIQAVLREITRARGKLNINFLKQLPVADAKQWLRSLHGVGPKTAAITLLFGLGCPAFPVDTHVHRVSGRLGLIPSQLSFDKAHDVLEALIPADIYYPLHINLIRHGRAICQAGRPHCEECMLTDLCDYFQTVYVRK